jgi:hypothetical protein
MIPIKILTPEQAVLLGLMKPCKKQKGKGLIATGLVVSGGKNKPDKLMEKSIIQDNKKELIFMDPEREQELKSRRQFSAYIRQFDKIPGGLK